MVEALGKLTRSKILLALLVGFCALYVRAVAVQTTTVDQPLRVDAREYYLSAYNLVHHGIYSRSAGDQADPPQAVRPDAYRPPGLPLLIAAFLAMSPDEQMTLPFFQVVNVLAGAGASVALFIAAAAVLPLPAAVAAGLLTAASPHLTAISVYLLTEPFAILLVAGLLMVTARAVPAKGPGRAAYFLALGIIVGLLALFRPIFIAFAPLLCLAFESRRDRLAALVAGCIGAACVVAPWMIRNALLPLDDQGSLIAATMLDGSYRGYVINDDPKTFPYPRFTDPIFETARQSVMLALSEVWARITADPPGMARWYVLEKAAYLLQWDNVDGAGDVFVYPVLDSPFASRPAFRIIHTLYASTHNLMMLLATIGSILVWTRSGRASPRMRVLRMASLLLIFLYTAHVPFFAATRYALPVFPALYLLCLIPLVRLCRIVKEVLTRPTSQTLTPTGTAPAD
ncbi:hypothetical protein X566_21740 [Afipia sp. P52-10]|uniref:hypothetical protein n=1 Tax=Afipia sp. P52-10 TaxID=1429916 RepID=UPI0003DF12DF|nr:hypothetical protein [Afipia sp. P52-10]ETR75946.1 hypothetical protein X566_21740 [Afipia sp. P52-10]